MKPPTPAANPPKTGGEATNQCPRGRLYCRTYFHLKPLPRRLPLLSALTLGTALHLPAAPAPTPPVTRFSGHLDHAPAGDTVRLFVGERRAQAALSPSGDFAFEFQDLLATTPVHFSYAGQSTRLYLMPGDQLRLMLDFKDFDKSLVYSGKGSDVNNYLAQAQWKFEYSPPGNEPRPMDQLEQQPGTTPAEMRRNADAFRQKRRAFLAEYTEAHPLPAAFRHDAEFGIDLAWGTQLLNYLSYSRAQSPAEAGPNQPLDPAYFSFLQQLPLRELDQHRRGLDENTAVAQFLNAYQDRLVPAGKLSTDPTEGPRLYQQATRELGEGKIRNLAMRMLLYWKIDADVAGAQVFYRTFKQHNSDSTLARDLRQAMAKKQNLSPGKAAPAFTLLDNTGKPVSLSDFKGKVVYLDFWGTWCGPCMQEMTESAPALKKKFEGRDVVFVYINVNDADAKWQKMLATEYQPGPASVHLRSPDDAVPDAYSVQSFPTYWVIGRDGRIVRTRAPRPSAGAETVALLEQALAQ